MIACWSWRVSRLRSLACCSEWASWSRVAWKGQPGNVAAAQQALAHRARLNGAAALGKYSASMEKELVPA
jgi:hypothetical protein